MTTLRDAAARRALVTRLQSLTPQSVRRWGTLTSVTALCHMSDQFRVALGEIVCVPHHNLLGRTIGKWIVVNTGMPAPRGRIQTAPEMLTSRPGTFADDLALCVRLAERVGTEAPMGIHPAFGPLSPEEWGRMGWKHTDHHLQQFGV